MYVIEKTGIRQFHAEDMLWIIESGIKEYGLKCIPDEQMRELAQAREDNGQCVTCWVDGKIIGCGGIDLMWPGVGEVWSLISYEIDSYKLLGFRTLKNGLRKLIDDNNLWRCQAWCRKDFDMAHTLFRHLGFKAEGIAEKYMADGTDAILYAKVRNV